jgi:hypothetical protein
MNQESNPSKEKQKEDAITFLNRITLTRRLRELIENQLPLLLQTSKDDKCQGFVRLR